MKPKANRARRFGNFNLLIATFAFIFGLIASSHEILTLSGFAYLAALILDASADILQEVEKDV